MTILLPTILLFSVFVFLFFREVKRDHKQFLKEHQLADEHILREVERFLKERRHCEGQMKLQDYRKAL